MSVAARRCLGAVILGVAALGCGGEPRVATTPVQLDGWAAIHREVLVPSCAFASCHGGAQPAARLDLSQPGSCAQLVGHMSCLFPGQPLVNAGAPEQSFLLAKLTGDGLAAQPETSCGGATNRRMPFGAKPLPPDQIAAVRAWIATGAACDEAGAPPPPDKTLVPGPGNGDGRLPAPAVPPPIAVQALAGPEAATLAGGSALLTITLSAPATDSGAPITLEISDRTILGAPAALLIPAGETTATATIIGKRPGAVTVSASAGPGSPPVTITVRISGLVLAETLLQGTTDLGGAAWVKLANISDAPIDLGDYRLTAGRGLMDDAATRLGGILRPGACFLIGGPHSDGDNGHPDLGQAWDFSAAVAGALGNDPVPFALALFDAAAPAAGGPIDAVAFGAAPPSLMGPGDQPLVVWPLPAAGQSLVRAGVSTDWRTQMTPTPNTCTLALPAR